MLLLMSVLLVRSLQVLAASSYRWEAGVGVDLWRLSGPTSLSRQGHLEPRTSLCPDGVWLSPRMVTLQPVWAACSSLMSLPRLEGNWNCTNIHIPFCNNTSENKTWPGTGSLSGSDLPRCSLALCSPVHFQAVSGCSDLIAGTLRQRMVSMFLLHK